MSVWFAAGAIGIVLTLLGLLKEAMERPPTCTKGHTDLYCLNTWKCRVCEAKKFNKKRRKKGLTWKPPLS
jgi:hypothetical protein